VSRDKNTDQSIEVTVNDLKESATVSKTDHSKNTCRPTWWAIKNVALYFCPYLRQLMTDFQNSFTDTLCGQFATM